MAVQADERTPLLATAAHAGGQESGPNGDAAAATTSSSGTTTTANSEVDGHNGNGTAAKPWAGDAAPESTRWQRLWNPANRVLLAGFIISLSFSFTQVSIFYVFRLMECDVYYENHPPYEGTGDRCSRNEIAAGTATQFSILGIGTTFCGTWNLFISGHQVKRWGPRTALVLQTIVPGIRVLAQITGVLAGGQAGIWIIQLTQVITILGGPAGYILVVNTIAGEVVPPLERTSLFGRLQGCIMLGTAIGYLSGGIVGDTYGVLRPFQVAAFLFAFASLYSRLVLPFIDPSSLVDPKKKSTRRKGLAGFFEPLKVLLPQRVCLASGRIVNHYGIFFLCAGVFLGVLATGYAPVLLQMYATATFEFTQASNAWLMSGYGFMRAVFLIFMFPRIISAGRHWFKTRMHREHAAAATGSTSPAASVDDDDDDTPVNETFPTDPAQFDAVTGQQVEEEPLIPDEHQHEEKAAYAFDLFFLRWSLFVDGMLTAGAALATEGWHMYLVTLLLPFGSGTAPAAKGVITTMCPSSQRTDALNAITLVENIARLATLGVFGFIFSALATVGKTYITFICNGAIALVAMAVLMFSHFPPEGSTMINDETHPETSTETAQDSA